MDKPHQSGDDADAVLAAFEQVPMLVVVCEGDPLVVRAHNALARTVVGDQDGRPLRETLDGVTSPELVERLERVLATGQPLVASLWPMTLPGAQDGAHYGAEPSARQILADVVAYPYFAADGSVRGVAVLAVDSAASPAGRSEPTATALPRHDQRPATRDIVTALQDALLPAGLPVVPGLQVAARCLLADSEAGGDWFDAISLDDGRLVLAVGDVVGHGVGAAVVMGELRALFEESVRQDGDLVAAVELLERRASRSLQARGATVCAVLLDPTTGDLEYVTAGHPPPLVVRAGEEAGYLPQSGGGALGVGHSFQVARHRLAVGDVLVTYTDGLVERAGHHPSAGTVELGRHVAAAVQACRAEVDGATTPVEQLATRLLEGPMPGGYDDVVLMVLQRTVPVAPLHLVLPAEPEALEVVRDAVEGWLLPLGISRIDHTVVQHSVGELVANVVEHAYAGLPDERRGDCAVDLRHLPGGMLELSVSDRGTWRPPDPSSTGGRGLAMVRGFCDEFELEHSPGGTQVCARHRPHGSAELLVGNGEGDRAHGGAALLLEDKAGELAADGVVDSSGADLLRHRLAKRSAGGLHPLLLDLTDVSLLASAGVQTLVDALTTDQGLRILAPMGSPAQHVLDLVELPYLTHRHE